jgi:peptidyl-prolyl cis-trans isomerase C
MQKRSFPQFAAVLAMALAFPIAAPAQDATANTVVATVNGTDITLGHMIALRARLPEQYQQLPDEVLFDGILDQLVQQAVLAQTTDGLNLGNALAIENETRSLLAGQVYNRVAEAAVTEENLQAAYDEAYANAAPEEEFDASHILVETEDAALALVEELNGGADFASLARENSTGPSGPNGGALGWFGKGMMVPEFETAVTQLDVGGISAPVQTQFGWHVIRLNDKRRKAAPPLETVQGELAQRLQRQAIEELVERLTAEADVTRMEPGTLDPVVLRDLSLLDN